MNGKLERVIRVLHKRRFAEKIAAAKDVSEAKKIYKNELKFIGKQVQGFGRDARKKLEAGGSPLTDEKFKVKASNAVEVAWIAQMTEISDVYLMGVETWEKFIDELKLVEGAKRKMAIKMAEILKENSFSDYTFDKLLEQII